MVEADSGSLGGHKSHEFQVLRASGEDEIAYCNNSDYAANVEEAVAQVPSLNSSNKESAFFVSGTIFESLNISLRSKSSVSSTNLDN